MASVFADQRLLSAQQMELITSLATPLSETRVFYRWERSEQAGTNRIASSTLSDRDYQYLLEKNRGYISGRGVYFSESIYSASQLPLSNFIIQVEIEKGVRILDTNNLTTKEQLEKAGITQNDIFDLQIDHLIINDSQEGMNDWWVLKGQKGIKFQPFSLESVTLFDLVMAQKLDFSGTKEQFKDLDKHIESTVKKAINSPIENLEDAVHIFILGRSHFSPQERLKVFNEILHHFRSTDDSQFLFKKDGMWLQRSILKHGDKNDYPFIRLLGLNTVFSKTAFFSYLSPSEQSTIMDRYVDHIHTMEDVIQMTKYRISSYEENEGLRATSNELFFNLAVSKVAHQPIRSIEEAMNFLFWGKRVYF